MNFFTTQQIKCKQLFAFAAQKFGGFRFICLICSVFFGARYILFAQSRLELDPRTGV